MKVGLNQLAVIAFLCALSATVFASSAGEAAPSEPKSKGIKVGLPLVKSPVSEPADCAAHSDQVCSMQTRAGEKFEIQVGNANVVLDFESTIIRTSQSAITLVNGTVWVKTSGEFTVTTEFGAAHVLGANEFWVHRTNERMIVSAVSESLLLKPRGSLTELRLEPGEENWIGGVGYGAREASSGIPQPILLESHLVRWARLYPGSSKQFHADVSIFKGKWSRGLATIADYHSQLAKNRREALAQESEERAKIKAQREARSQELRSLFRRKVLFD